MKHFTPHPTLRRFVDRLLNGERLTKSESAHLEELLESDDALAYYVSTVQQESLIPLALVNLPQPLPMTPRIHRWKRPLQSLAVAAAACLVFAFGFFAGKRRSGPSAHAGAATLGPRITALVGVEWESGLEPELVSKDSSVKRVAFRSGLAELVYGNGVRVTLQGPADFSITGPNSGRLDKGRIVTSVPKGAEGFKVAYHGGTVVDLGTEFGLDIASSGKVELGVFKGEVELHRPNEPTLSLLEDQAIRLDSSNKGEAVGSIPLDRVKFVRQIPARDFRWEVTSPAPTHVEFDVSHLVWKAAEYRVIFKWMQGIDGVQISDVSLCLDGVPVSRNFTSGAAGGLFSVHNNLFNLPVTPQQFQRGHWTLRATLKPLPFGAGRDLARDPISCVGVLLFEEGFISDATAEDFIGTWRYNCDGIKFERHFHADGTMSMTKAGVELTGPDNPFSDSRWRVEGGVLHLTIPQSKVEEEHVLRDHDTLIFVKNPYENAKRLEK